MMLGCSGLEPSVITSRCLTTKDDEPPVLQNVPEQQKDHDESEVQGGREQASDPADGKATPPVAHVRALPRAHAPWTRRGPHGRLWAQCRRLGSARAEPGQRGTRADRRELGCMMLCEPGKKALSLPRERVLWTRCPWELDGPTGS
uniref:Uncharacterized protein n=1 Tax=Rangifer tarandus platyrhynchus TaxID=3082113 RepID=A0ACB0FHF0_RANTA|nr:unnamed protein product [Rangifer tarandus platyrhynchus]